MQRLFLSHIWMANLGWMAVDNGLGRALLHMQENNWKQVRPMLRTELSLHPHFVGQPPNQVDWQMSFASRIAVLKVLFKDPLVSLSWCPMRSSLFQLYICMKLNFLHILQPKLYYNMWMAETETRFQLSSHEPESKKINKQVDAILLTKSLSFLVLENSFSE